MRTAASCLLLGLGLLIVYGPALHGAYLWDDDTHYTANPVLQAGGLLRAWLGREQPNYWPLTWTSFWLEHRLFGFAPLASHAINVLLHAANACLLGRLLRRLGCPLPWVAVLLFAFHPANVESVAWVTQRKNLLCALFALAASVDFARRLEAGRAGPSWPGVAWFAASLLSKGASLGLPLVFLLVARWKRVSLDRRLAIELAPYFALSCVFGVVELLFMHTVKANEAVFDVGALARVGLVARNLSFYVSKAVLPIDLVFVYPRWDLAHIRVLDLWPLGALVALGIAAAALRARGLLAALASFVVMLAPIAGITDVYYFKYAYVADHYLYLALPALAAPVAYGLARIPRAHAWAGIAVLCGLMAAAVYTASASYRDDETLWRATLERNPRAWIGQSILGVIAQRRGQLDEARQRYVAALSLHPGDYDAALVHLNLGNVLLLSGDPDAAQPHFERTLERLPDHTQAWCNLAAVYAARGDLEGYDRTLLHALEHHVDAVRVHELLAASLRERGDDEQARRHLERAAERQRASGR